MATIIPYKLFYSPDSANLIVRMVLEELAVPYEAVLVDRGKQEEKSETYRRLNPQGLIPVLVDGDTVLFETAAIVLYLADKHAALAPSFNTPARGHLYKWLFYLSNTLHADLRIQFYTSRYVADEAAVPAVREGVRQRLVQHFDLIDGVIGEHSGLWLLSSGLSVCDFYLAACCRWTVLYPPGEVLSHPAPIDFPNLRRLLEALESQPSVSAACEKEGIQAPFFTKPRIPTPREGSVL